MGGGAVGGGEGRSDLHIGRIPCMPWLFSSSLHRLTAPHRVPRSDAPGCLPLRTPRLHRQSGRKNTCARLAMRSHSFRHARMGAAESSPVQGAQQHRLVRTPPTPESRPLGDMRWRHRQLVPLPLPARARPVRRRRQGAWRHGDHREARRRHPLHAGPPRLARTSRPRIQKRVPLPHHLAAHLHGTFPRFSNKAVARAASPESRQNNTY